MKAVARELLWRDVVAKRTGLRSLGDEIAEELRELVVRAGNVFPTMEERCELGPMALMGDQRERLEHCLEPLDGVAGSIANRCQLLQVARHLSLVPRDQDCLDIREILVKRRT